MIELLKKIIEDKINRRQYIDEFQNIVWNDENSSELFADLALDLDYYEKDEKLRAQDPSYYGDERLEKEVNEVLEKLGAQ